MGVSLSYSPPRPVTVRLGAGPGVPGCVVGEGWALAGAGGGVDCPAWVAPAERPAPVAGVEAAGADGWGVIWDGRYGVGLGEYTALLSLRGVAAAVDVPCGAGPLVPAGGGVAAAPGVPAGAGVPVGPLGAEAAPPSVPAAGAAGSGDAGSARDGAVAAGAG